MLNAQNVQALSAFARLAAGSSVRRSESLIRVLDDGHQVGVQCPFLLKNLFKQSLSRSAMGAGAQMLDDPGVSVRPAGGVD